MARFFAITSLALLLAASLSICSCARTALVGNPNETEPFDDAMSRHAGEIGRYYHTVGIRRFADLSEEEYSGYRNFVAGNTIDVIVHPAYYLFFHDNNDNKIFVNRGENFSKNIVDLFLEEYPVDGGTKLERMKSTLHNERDYLREKSRRRNLVLLVLPPRYRTHPEYPYRKLDEFGRYLNEVTGNSPSVLYVESESFKDGYLSGETIARLRLFFQALDIRTVRIGGGYRDQCVSNFSRDIARIYAVQHIVLVPEICSTSPDLIISN